MESVLSDDAPGITFTLLSMTTWRTLK